MIARLTWAPDDGPIQTLTVDLPADRITEIRALIGTPEWATSEAVAWIDYRTGTDGPFARGLFRLARITALEAEGA